MLPFYLTNMIYQGNILHLGNIFINLYLFFKMYNLLSIGFYAKTYDLHH